MQIDPMQSRAKGARSNKIKSKKRIIINVAIAIDTTR